MDAIRDSISKLSQEFGVKLAEFEARQQRLSATHSPIDGGLAADFSTFKLFTLSSLRALQQQVEILAQQHDNLEMHTRRKILLLHGVPETKEEDTAAKITELVTETLKMRVFQATDIKRCHRMGRSSSSDHPRPILFKLRDTALRAELWAAKKSFKSSGITMSEFLTKTRHDAFMAARQRFGVSKCWTHNGTVIVLGQDGTRRRICSMVDLEKLGPAPSGHSSSQMTTVASVCNAAVTGTAGATARLPLASDRPSRRVPKLKTAK